MVWNASKSNMTTRDAGSTDPMDRAWDAGRVFSRAVTAHMTVAARGGKGGVGAPAGEGAAGGADMLAASCELGRASAGRGSPRGRRGARGTARGVAGLGARRPEEAGGGAAGRGWRGTPPTLQSGGVEPCHRSGAFPDLLDSLVLKASLPGLSGWQL